MKKRQLNKLKKLAKEIHIEPTIQEAWEIVAAHIIKNTPVPHTAFIESTNTDYYGHLILHSVTDPMILKSKKKREEY